MEGLIAIGFIIAGAFAFAGSAHAATGAATLYFVGTGNTYTTAASWHSSAKACDDAGNADAAPDDDDIIIFADNCDTSVAMPATEVLAGVQLANSYSGTVTGSGTTLDINGNFSVGSTGTFTLNGGTMTLSGDFTKGAGTFTHANGTVDFDGSSQTITGSSTLYRLIKTETSATTLKINSGDTVTVTDALTITGSTGALVTFEATTGGTAATVAISGATITVNHVTVKDITASGGTILCNTACTNRGNNTGWTMPEDDEESTPGSNFALDSVIVNAPNGGETLAGGSVTTISWDAAGDALNVELYYSRDAGVQYELIADNLDLQGEYEWTVPNVATMKGKVKAMMVNAGGGEVLSDASDRVFTVTFTQATEEPSDDQAEDHVIEFVDMTRPGGLTTSMTEGTLFRGVTLSSVYIVNGDGTRSVFPNEAAFNSYGYSFANVVTVNDDQLQKMALGGRVRMKQGSLIKLQYDPKVYEVDADGVLRHVPDEFTADVRYGAGWASNIVDVSDVFWGDYTVGAPLISAYAYIE